MALLPILRFPDVRLKKVAAPVTHIDDSIRKLAADMAETMYEAPGIGLAATQVDVHKRLIVIDLGRQKRSAGFHQSGTGEP
jgi:peptide deformylase